MIGFDRCLTDVGEFAGGDQASNQTLPGLFGVRRFLLLAGQLGRAFEILLRCGQLPFVGLATVKPEPEFMQASYFIRAVI